MNSITLAEILNEALMDEYKARDTYAKIIDTFGPVRPFINIVEAEQRHIELLLPLYDKYAIPLPVEPDPKRMSVPESLLDACQMGVEGNGFRPHLGITTSPPFNAVLNVLVPLRDGKGLAGDAA
jgi:hypothetical protein